MSRIVSGLLVLALVMPALAASGQTKEKPVTPAEQYQMLVKAYQEAMQTYSEAWGKAQTYDERCEIS